ncbi:hypothetical protein DASC09_063570 [Saccharomycopsis crataegensis]|uniref:Zn(2)-C6 fungal-type domain-containing protein n=1 Tax=Saccharomycopsis crataegensis TaxID=43959 RepID=A0AAV5QVQ0_9ASCO|nr:hypothetical protein DASC09_063570 [Saccharomycopsis crataegensis]
MNSMNIVPNKRKRVLRACDECTKKKVKCDGQNPCIHCKVYNYKCSYNQPANKKSKNFQADLQNKITSYEFFLSMVFPGIQLPKIASLQAKDIAFVQSLLQPPDNRPKSEPLEENIDKDFPIDDKQGPSLDIKQFVEKFNAEALPAAAAATTPNPKQEGDSTPMATSLSSTSNNNSQAFNLKLEPDNEVIPLSNENNTTPISATNNDDDDDHHNHASSQFKVVKISLPSLDDSLRLLHVACDSALLFKFYNRLNLINIVKDFYNTAESFATNNNDLHHNKKLACIYSFLAIGALLENDDNAYNYYNAAYSLIKKKLVETNDVMNIQTLFCLIIFLQCTANLSTCYSFVGIALRSAFRIGLHRKAENSNAIVQENRKRLFWSIYKIDVYMNTVLGLPQISDDQIDQDLPLDIEDEFIAETGYIAPKNRNKKLTTIAISNDHTKLIIILNHIVKNIYPINTDSYYEEKTRVKDTKTNFIYQLISKVKLMEQELSEWLENLPMELNPDNINIPIKFYKQNRLLKLAYLHVQLALYRPFIHLISHKYIQLPNINQDSIKYGMNCINVAIKIIELATEMHEHQLLNGAYWFSIYPIFYSVACLVYYIHENSNSDLSANVWQITKYAEKGKDVLVDLKSSSMAAAKTYQTLNVMFEKLNRRTKKFHTNHQKYFEDNKPGDHEIFGPMGLQDQQRQNNGEGRFLNGTYYNADSIITNPQPSFQLDMKYLATEFANDNDKQNGETNYQSKNAEINSSNSPIPNNNNNNNNGNSNNNNSNSNSNNNNNNNNSNPFEDQRYFGGMIDKFDMNLFGRFLPPYMLESKSNNSNFNQQMSRSDSNLELPNR